MLSTPHQHASTRLLESNDAGLEKLFKEAAELGLRQVNPFRGEELLRDFFNDLDTPENTSKVRGNSAAIRPPPTPELEA